MVALDLIMDGTVTASGPAFDPSKAVHINKMVSIMGMPRGTKEGNPSVILRVPTPDGKEVWVETTLKLLCTAAETLKVYYQTHHGFKL